MKNKMMKKLEIERSLISAIFVFSETKIYLIKSGKRGKNRGL